MIYIKKTIQNLVITLSLITSVGCSTAKPEKAHQSAKLSDANIAAIVVGANNIDISAGNIALKRSNL